MKCYRVYVDGECVGTYFNRLQAIFVMNDWFGAGYDSDRVDMKTEDF